MCVLLAPGTVPAQGWCLGASERAPPGAATWAGLGPLPAVSQGWASLRASQQLPAGQCALLCQGSWQCLITRPALAQNWQRRLKSRHSGSDRRGGFGNTLQAAASGCDLRAGDQCSHLHNTESSMELWALCPWTHLHGHLSPWQPHQVSRQCHITLGSASQIAHRKLGHERVRMSAVSLDSRFASHLLAPLTMIQLTQKDVWSQAGQWGPGSRERGLQGMCQEQHVDPTSLLTGPGSSTSCRQCHRQ